MVYLDFGQHKLYLVSLELLCVGATELLLLPQCPSKEILNRPLKIKHEKLGTQSLLCHSS